jgi:hypothetical protein
MDRVKMPLYRSTLPEAKQRHVKQNVSWSQIPRSTLHLRCSGRPPHRSPLAPPPPLPPLQHEVNGAHENQQ